MNTVCDKCREPVEQVVYCDCFATLCTDCFGKHACGRERLARFSGGSREAMPPDEDRVIPVQLLVNAMPPRDYQLRCIEATYSEFLEVRKTLVVMPTGTGKTVVFGHVTHRWEDGRVLIVAHRDELIRQAADKVGRIIGEPCDIEMGESYADRGALMGGKAKVVVTSVQTMSRDRRMQAFSPNEFGLVIIDEAHHAVASTYQKVIDFFCQNPKVKVLGVTATPDRTDETALGKVFESVAFDYQLPDAIRDGWLVNIQQQFVFVEGLDFSGIRTTAGDLNAGDLAKVMEAEEMLHRVVAPTIELAGDQQCLVFASSVAHAERMAEICNRHKAGSAEFICGETDTDIRRDILRRYKKQEFQFLFNCMIATEGFDEPSIGVVAIAKPTKSRALYAQMIGRGTRALPGVVDGPETPDERRAAIQASGKPAVLVLDFVGNSGRHKLVSTADILGGSYDDEIVDSAKAEAAAKSKRGEAVDIQDEIEKALERSEAEKRRRAHVVAEAKFGTKNVSPFDVFDVAPKREPGWFKGKKPTPKMIDMLTRAGVATADLSFWDAKQICGEVIGRREKGLCSYKQAKILRKHGFNADVPFAEASQIIDRIAKSNWQLMNTN